MPSVTLGLNIARFSTLADQKQLHHHQQQQQLPDVFLKRLPYAPDQVQVQSLVSNAVRNIALAGNATIGTVASTGTARYETSNSSSRWSTSKPTKKPPAGLSNHLINTRTKTIVTSSERLPLLRVLTNSKISEFSQSVLFDELSSIDTKNLSKLQQDLHNSSINYDYTYTPSSSSSASPTTQIPSRTGRSEQASLNSKSPTSRTSTYGTPPELPRAAEPSSHVVVESDSSQRLHKLQAMIRQHFGSDFKSVTVSNGPNSTIRMSLPHEVLKESGTLRHFQKSMRSFREGITNSIELPTLDSSILLDAAMFMIASYHSKQSRTELSFNPVREHLLELMDAAVYLDLPGLVNICAQQAAENLFDVDSFGDLQSVCIRNILRRAAIPQLCWAEHRVLKSEFSTDSIWHSRYCNILAASSAVTLSSPRLHCIKHYVEECLAKPLSSDTAVDVLYVLEHDGLDLEEMKIGTAPWETFGSRQRMRKILNSLPKCTRLTITLRKFHAAMVSDILADSRAWKRNLTLEIPCNGIPASVNLSPLLTRTLQESSSVIPARDKSGMAVMLDKTQQLEVGESLSRQETRPTRREEWFGISLRLVPSAIGLSDADFDSFLNDTLSSCYISELDTSKMRLCPEFISNLVVNTGSRLTRLKLSSSGINSLSLINLFRSLTSYYSYLQELDISQNLNAPSDASCTEAAQYLSKYLSSPQCRIRTLNISSTRLGVSGLLSLFEGVSRCKTLQHLNLADTDMSPVSSALFTCLETKPLESLNLAGNSLPPRMVLTLLGNASHGIASFVRDLNLNGCLWHEECIEKLAAALENSSCRLTHLHLAGGSASLSHGLEDKGCSILASGIQRNRSLLRLDISSQQIGDYGLKKLFQAAIHCPTLHTIIAQENCVTSDSIKVVNKLLRKTPSSATGSMYLIDLRENFIKGPVTEFLNAVVLTGTSRNL
ncbi:hypothetical protein SmJEL517_g00913 [Synchytrium microbalum]|uniref:BTB domain-containing protein n=1 Tax=Synchytrium microbalum TaxID=1806994 RepID=A0A507C5R9_9FUNG|nr:uncharacterized protein SmJEL517_g00913 [Synchytrium microbalum]TPX36930.1 hypothetical protein SmJEL517_g00913 [Synchytrium microbalum]